MIKHLLRLVAVRGKRGVSTVESAIALPFMVIFAFTVSDFGMFLQTYESTAQTMRDTLRYGMGIAELEETVAPLTTAAAAGMQHANIHQRVNDLLTIKKLQIVPGSAQIRTECESTSKGFDKITVEVEVTYNPINPVLAEVVNAVHIKVRGVAPYLYSNCA